jgi:hypothetical protein
MGSGAGFGVVVGWVVALVYLLVRYMRSAHWFGPVGPPNWSPCVPSCVLAPLTLLGAALVAGLVTSRSEPEVVAWERP